jgi:6-phosphogluconolactonase
MFAYVGSRTTRERNARGDGINVYRVDPVDQTWIHVQKVEGLVNPSFLAFGRNERFLYTVHGDCSEVSAFRIDPVDGRLSFLNRQSTKGKNPVHLAADPEFQFLAVSNYGSGSVALLPLNADGAIGEVVDLVDVPGQQGPHRVEQPHARPHHIPFDRDGRFMVVPDKGLDKIFTLSIDKKAGKLVLNGTGVETRENSGPRHVDFHPHRPFAYVVNELDSTVTAYRYEARTGTLSPFQVISALPQTFTGNSRASEIAVHRSGKFLCTSNRGYDSIAIFDIEPETGCLSPKGWVPTKGRTPRFFAFDPSGSFLYAANEDSDQIVSFRVGESGELSPTDQVIETGSPVCIVFSPS